MRWDAIRTWLLALEQANSNFPHFERLEDPKLSRVFSLEEGVHLAVLPNGFFGKQEHIILEFALPPIPGVVITPRIETMMRAANSGFLREKGVRLLGEDSFVGLVFVISRRLDSLPLDGELRQIVDGMRLIGFSTWQSIAGQLVQEQTGRGF
jgi:hypothetical protein